MAGINTEEILARRDHFPRGLIQPEGGYRFSQDSLLLASFASPGRIDTGIDLGCGCGAIGLALLLRQPGLTLTGVDIDPLSVEAARENVVNLHFPGRYAIVEGDVVSWRPEKTVDFVISNPPYRQPGRSRVSPAETVANARFEARADFAQFARCAAVALKSRGKFAFVHLPERLTELMAGLTKAGLEPKRMRLVHGRADEAAKMVLMEAMKGGGVGLKVEPPLILHEGTGQKTRLTGQVLEFCPYLVADHETGEGCEDA